MTTTTTPEDDEASEPVILENDDQDTVAQTRPLPEAEPAQHDQMPADQLPTIGHVGRYALKYCIGEGGLGTVYAAHDPLLSRLIAIKTMQIDLPEQDREQFNAMFLNEAKAAGSLSHPHIVTVYDAGAGSQGTYMAMELLRGKDLRQLLAMGWRPTPAQAALIVRRVADALSYAHHKGVIHRDIKPANIFMVGRTQPRVLDFGIARMRQVESGSAEEGMSRFGELVGGSPHYMSPEQVHREPVDRRVDVYALGVVFYELLTGRKPFVGHDLDAITRSVLEDEVTPPHELNPEVPRELSDIALRAMAREVGRRTRSARTLSRELREWLDNASDDAPAAKNGKAAKAPKAAAAPAVALQGGAPAERQPAKALLVGLAAVGLLILAGGAAWWGLRQSDAQDPAALAAADAASAAASAAVAEPVVPAAPVAQVPVEREEIITEAPAAPASGPAVAAVASPVAPAAPATTPPATAGAAPVATEQAKAPVPTGTVKLAITPWGRVSVGRKSMGVTPPLTQLTLPQGRHTIVIRNEDFPPYQQTVEVKAGQSVTVNHAF
ncbi:MAG: serine/threonine-protein kinase [Pseudomonadota bacterium]